MGDAARRLAEGVCEVAFGALSGVIGTARGVGRAVEVVVFHGNSFVVSLEADTTGEAEDEVLLVAATPQDANVLAPFSKNGHSEGHQDSENEYYG